ncbi:MAG: Response regulator containing a CheY-like receiver domain and a GGDEF domain [Bacteroidetes bacterium HLUCCA01]|nr:MAG: Response regulator containing a CheY-like receiver domain and a GGDEF domain [Bacteroidetes bacterium HLUCCA01]
MRILIVEDDRVNVRVLTAMTKLKGHEVLTAWDGFQALKILEEEKVDLIFMDVNMPLMDGFETTRRIRKIPGMETVPIVAVTADNDAVKDERNISSGITDVVLKPYRVAKIDEIITKFTTSA